MKKATLQGSLAVITAVLVGVQPSLASDADSYREITDKVYFYGGSGQTLEGMLWSSPSKYQAATDELHNLITSAALSVLKADHASSESVGRAVEELQGKFTLGALYAESDIPFADLREIAGFKILFLAVSIMSGGGGIPNNISWLQYYSNKSGTWKLVSEESGVYDGSIFSVANIGPVLPYEARYLSWGRVIGDGHAVGKLRGYAFDGTNVRTFYSRDNVWGGMISVQGDRVSITYQEKPESPFAAPRFIHEELDSTVDGLREVSHESVSDYPTRIPRIKTP